jgi:hypothetical protein
MAEKSNLEILSKFAKSTNRDFEYKEVEFPTSGIRKIPKFKRWAYISNNHLRETFFVWFGNPYENIGIPTVFCGAFIPLPFQYDSKLNIRKKNILDKISLFDKNKNNILGNDSFDKKVIIKGDVDSKTKRLLANTKLQKCLLSALDLNTLINISIDENEIDFVPELKNNSYLAVINPQSWYLKKSEIEKMLKSAEEIRKTIYP